MRTMVFILAIATLAGCGWSHDPRTTDAAARPNPSTVAVNYKGPDGFNLAVSKADEWWGQQQFNQAVVQAANWCRARYGSGATLVDKARSTAGDVVAFACRG